MPREKDFKRRVRMRMARTGERYTQARQRLTASQDHFDWHLAGSHRQAYELTQARDPRHPRAAVQILRCTGDPEGGFGTVMTSVDAARLPGRARPLLCGGARGRYHRVVRPLDARRREGARSGRSRRAF